jgi:hypothetical protein
MQNDLIGKRQYLVGAWSHGELNEGDDRLLEALRDECEHSVVVQCLPGMVGAPRICVFCGLVEYSETMEHFPHYRILATEPKLQVTPEVFTKLMMELPNLQLVLLPVELEYQPDTSAQPADAAS